MCLPTLVRVCVRGIMFCAVHTLTPDAEKYNCACSPFCYSLSILNKAFVVVVVVVVGGDKAAAAAATAGGRATQ